MSESMMRRSGFDMSLARSSFVRQSISKKDGAYDDSIKRQLRTKLDGLQLYGEIRCLHPTEYFMVQQPSGGLVTELMLQAKILKVDRREDGVMSAALENISEESFFNQGILWIAEE